MTVGRVLKIGGWSGLVLGAVSLLGVCILSPWVCGFLGSRPLPVVSGVRDQLSPSAYRFALPTLAEDTLIRVGIPPTPINLVTAISTPSHRVLLLYETLGAMPIISVDLRSGTVHETSANGVRLAYAAVVDGRDPNIVWIGASLPATLLRFDIRTGQVEVVARLQGESHIFTLDQGPDGALYLGTYPGARCLRVPLPGAVPLQIEELPVPRALIGHRPYLHGLFPAGGKLLLHYASPGLLVQYDLVSREAERLLVSERAFLGFDASPQGLVVTSEQETLTFDRGDQGVRERAAARAPTVLESVSDGTLRVRTAEREVEISLTPRSQGMSVTALSTVFDGAAIVGASYWNHWVFTIDPVRRSVVGRGELPSGWGEFFVAADRAAQVVIPSYQGDVYLFDLRAADRDPHLPEQWLFRVLKVPDAHFGLAMALGEGGRLYYSTHPNYNQRGGMLVCLMPDLTAHVRERLDADTTIAALVFSGGVLYGATTQARGLGLGSPDSPGLPPSVLALSSDDLSTLSSARCGTDNTDSIEAMIPAGDGRLLAGTRKGRLFLVETGRTPLACHQTHSFGLLRQPIRRMIPLDPVHALIVTNSALFVYEWSSGRLSFLVRLPIKVRFAALVSTGDLYLATRGEIFVLPAAVLSRRLPGARAAGSASSLRLRRVLNTGGSP